MHRFFRVNEYKVLAYRLLLVYVMYFVARVLFFYYNNDLLDIHSFKVFIAICYHGLVFDTTAILYINSIFIVLSVFPFWVNTKPVYQKFIFYWYMLTNLTFYSLNFVDLIYYRYNFARTTMAVVDILKNEKSLTFMFFRFLYTYWLVFLLFIGFSILWVFLYKKIKVQEIQNKPKAIPYLLSSIIGVLIVATLSIGGIRGDFKKSTRPINLVDANRYVKKPQQADLVLNTPFAFLRTLGVKSFKKPNFNIPESFINATFSPIKQYNNNPSAQPNIVLIITESFGREYSGAFNKHTGIKEYVSHTPFIDSLAQHSLIFSNAYANGYKSIHGMSSILSGVPSFKDAFTSSPYAKQDIQSLVSTLKDKGYDTSFFHGAPNGSMGFLGFGNILGFDHYYGMSEYGNDDDFDGSWGIWDEPFMQFMKNTIDTKKAPFFTTLFTVSSHEPYIVPNKYKSKFPKGNIPMHQCISYTDFSFKKFFDAAKKEPWYNNTVFIITADHCNQVYYTDYYLEQIMNRLAIPILIFDPNGKYKGENTDLAQHIDIYPTVLDMIGYNDPFRSWGSSLLDKNHKDFVFNYNSGVYYYAEGKYICTFDGKKAIGFYSANDKKLTKNLIKSRNKEMNNLEISCKAFLQDYYARIIDKKLNIQ
jgi:phosphoglycerol transferase MdoB-like AlkP superfamily enzyme